MRFLSGLVAFTLWCPAFLCPGAGLAAAQQMPGMDMGKMHLVPPPEQMPVPIRMTGLGNAHIAITASPEAQAWFDQGLNLMHDFWDYESTKAFEQGLRVDPNCAMCWWGLAQVEGFRGGPGTVYGTRALTMAVGMKGRVAPSEKLYIEALQEERKDVEGKKHKNVAKLRKLVKKYPGDLEARVFLALAMEDGYEKGLPKAGEKEGIAMLEAVLRDAPNDSAANHYWIHAIEPGPHPELAIRSAALLASLAPTSGHMVHMPGHIYYRVGNYPEAQKWFDASTEADERYMREQHVGPDDDWNYVHNMMYSIANLMEQGKMAEANALSDRLAGARGELSASLYIGSARDSMARISRRLPVALRVGDWEAVLTMVGAPLPAGDTSVNLAFLTSELKEYATGMRALELGQTAGAEAAAVRLDAALEAKRKVVDAPVVKGKTAKPAEQDKAPMMPVMPDANAGPLVKSLTIASLELRAGILVANGKLDEAKKMYATAAVKEKDAGYREPPFDVRPVAETEAAALVRAKDYAGAAAAYEAALVERPASGFGLYGLARVKELSGDASGARAGYAAFLKVWNGADAELPEVVHARQVAGGSAAAAI